MIFKYPNEFLIAPISFNLDYEFDDFQDDRLENEKCYYILKPVAASCGRGIKVVDSKKVVSREK